MIYMCSYKIVHGANTLYLNLPLELHLHAILRFVPADLGRVPQGPRLLAQLIKGIQCIKNKKNWWDASYFQNQGNLRQI